MRYAVIDTGSNTIRLGIYEEENGTLSQIYNHAVFANLASYVKNGILSNEGICVAKDTILSQIKTAATYDCTPHVFATAAIRNAKNTEEICQHISRSCGVSIDVLTGEEEALFSFYGAANDFPCSDGIMADVGGGSSEIISFLKKEPIKVQSVPWGSLKSYNTFIAGAHPTKESLFSIQNAVTESLKQTDSFCNKTYQNLCIVGGGVSASQKLAKAILHKETLSVQTIKDLLSFLTDYPKDAEQILLQLVPDRAKTLAPALAIYAAVGTFFRAEQVFVSDKGIKEGYILKKMMI